jgi:AraC family ethanolamine operon transcriptional activator
MSELLRDPGVLRDQQTSDEIAWAIAGNILKTLATGRETASEAPRTPRLRVCDDSLDFIAAHPGHSLTVREVADAVGVSERTLRRSFQDRFGVSTKEYIKARRLRATRRDLFRSSPDETQVRQVALRWGFWHSSQFAQDYRRAFGELPSDTLKRQVDHRNDP